MSDEKILLDNAKMIYQEFGECKNINCDECPINNCIVEDTIIDTMRKAKEYIEKQKETLPELKKEYINTLKNILLNIDDYEIEIDCANDNDCGECVFRYLGKCNLSEIKNYIENIFKLIGESTGINNTKLKTKYGEIKITEKENGTIKITYNTDKNVLIKMNSSNSLEFITVEPYKNEILK